MVCPVHHHVMAPYTTLKLSTVCSNNSTTLGSVRKNEGFVTRFDL